jgi:spoIIIJ-associated protein
MKQYEFSSKNVQDAIQKGLKELNVKQEEVDIKILSEGGLFSKAKILIITEEEDDIIVEPKKEEVKPETIQKDKKTELKKEKVVEEPKKEKTTTSKKTVKKEDTLKQSVTFMKTLAELLGAKVETQTEEQDENLIVSMNGENAGVLIGYRGEGLTGIQYLANVIEQHTEENQNKKRIILNVENYKEKREESLKRLAQRMAKKAIRTGRSQRLEPMNAYDRRIIHSALTDSDVTTYSKGDEPRRFLVIDPKK